MHVASASFLCELGDGSPNFVAVYLDDILIFSESFADHKYHIKQVLQKLEEVNLKLNPKKCHFGCQVVEYLGHILTPNGLQPNPERVTAVKKFVDVKTVKQFLGLALFYRKFVQRSQNLCMHSLEKVLNLNGHQHVKNHLTV